MSARYHVNVVIGAGTSFNQDYYLTGPDMDPLDITGNQFSAHMAKHPRAYDALAEQTTYNYVPFDCFIENGPQGRFSLNMDPEITNTLEEGKYVYSASMRDNNGYLYEVVSGLAFVDVSFGYPGPNAIINDVQERY